MDNWYKNIIENSSLLTFSFTFSLTKRFDYIPHWQTGQ